MPVESSLFRAVLAQSYLLILQDLDQKNYLILLTLLEPKRSQVVKNLSLPRFASISTRLSRVLAEKLVQFLSTDRLNLQTTHFIGLTFLSRVIRLRVSESSRSVPK